MRTEGVSNSGRNKISEREKREKTQEIIKTEGGREKPLKF